MNMWEPLIGLLDSSSETITLNTLWILGTAIQNNPKAQEDVGYRASPRIHSHRPIVSSAIATC